MNKYEINKNPPITILFILLFFIFEYVLFLKTPQYFWYTFLGFLFLTSLAILSITNCFGGRWYLLTYLIIITFFSKALWGPILSQLQQFILVWYLLRVTALISGILIAFYIALQFANHVIKNKSFKINSIEKVLIILTLFSFFEFLNGLIRKNNPILIIGDTFILSFIPLIYYLIIKTIEREKVFSFVKISIFFIFLLNVISFIIWLVRLTKETKGIYAFGNIWFLLPVIFFTLYFTYYPQKKLYLLLSLLSIFLVIIGLKRGPWIGLFVSMSLFPLFIPRKRLINYFANTSKIIVPCIIICSLAFIIIPQRNAIIHYIEEKINYTVNFTLAGHHYDILEGRLTEALYAVKQMGRGLSFGLDYFIGMGNGATYSWIIPRTESPLFSNNKRIHTIHITVANIFFRTGLAGVIIFVWFVLVILITLYRMTKNKNIDKKDRIILTTSLLYFCASLINSFFVYHIFNDIFWGILLGSIGIIYRNLTKEKALPSKV